MKSEQVKRVTICGSSHVVVITATERRRMNIKRGDYLRVTIEKISDVKE